MDPFSQFCKALLNRDGSCKLPTCSVSFVADWRCSLELRVGSDSLGRKYTTYKKTDFAGSSMK